MRPAAGINDVRPVGVLRLLELIAQGDKIGDIGLAPLLRYQSGLHRLPPKIRDGIHVKVLGRTHLKLGSSLPVAAFEHIAGLTCREPRTDGETLDLELKLGELDDGTHLLVLGKLQVGID